MGVWGGSVLFFVSRSLYVAIAQFFDKNNKKTIKTIQNVATRQFSTLATSFMHAVCTPTTFALITTYRHDYPM